MNICVLSKRRARVSKPLAHHLCILAGGEKKRGARMAEVIQPYVGKFCFFEEWLEVSPVEVSDQDRRP